jgi:hypothetical protein
MISLMKSAGESGSQHGGDIGGRFNQVLLYMKGRISVSARLCSLAEVSERSICGIKGTGEIGIFTQRAIHLSEDGETGTKMTLSSKETFSYVL